MCFVPTPCLIISRFQLIIQSELEHLHPYRHWLRLAREPWKVSANSLVAETRSKRGIYPKFLVAYRNVPSWGGNKCSMMGR